MRWYWCDTDNDDDDDDDDDNGDDDDEGHKHVRVPGTRRIETSWSNAFAFASEKINHYQFFVAFFIFFYQISVVFSKSMQKHLLQITIMIIGW